MSNIFLGCVQLADLHATLQECINNRISSECSDKFHCSVFQGIAPDFVGENDYNTLSIRSKKLTEFIRQGMRWNELAVNARYDTVGSRSEEEVEAILKSGRVTSMEQALLSLRALEYNSDYDAHATYADENEMADYEYWEERAKEMIHKMAMWIAERECNKAKAKWIY